MPIQQHESTEEKFFFISIYTFSFSDVGIIVVVVAAALMVILLFCSHSSKDLNQGSAKSAPRAKSGPRVPSIWPAASRQF